MGKLEYDNGFWGNCTIAESGVLMAFKIAGKLQGAEYEAALVLQNVIEPHLRTSDEVVVVCNPMCYGADVQELDLLILGTFGTGLEIGKHLEGRNSGVSLINLCLIVELKEHSLGRVRFSGQRVLVELKRYGGDGLKFEKDATEQVWKQKLSLNKYLEKNHIQSPWITGAIWLPNYHGKVPSQASNVIAGKPTFTEVVRLIERVKEPTFEAGVKRAYISFSTNTKIRSVVKAINLFTTELSPGGIDRRRIEQVCKRLIGNQKYADNLGSQLLLFRGRGGSGKTIHLLRIAKDLVDSGHRVLLLTFNQALVSDLRRLMSIIGITDTITEPCFAIKTVHQFIGSLLEDWCEFEWSKYGGEKEAFQAYELNKSKLLELFEGETPESICSTERAITQAELYAWDFILVDEGQDWPKNEREILLKVFGNQRLIVADGVDQLVRSQERCDWTQTLDRTQRQIVPLRQSMRMKSQLVKFINTFASIAGLDWEIEPLEELSGGRIMEWVEKIGPVLS